MARTRNHRPIRQITAELKRQGTKRSPATLVSPVRLQVRIETIPVEMEWDEEAAKWVTYVPLLNNISTFGSTQTEALHHTREMILAYVESMSEDGLPLPLTQQEVKSLITALQGPNASGG